MAAPRAINIDYEPPTWVFKTLKLSKAVVDQPFTARELVCHRVHIVLPTIRQRRRSDHNTCRSRYSSCQARRDERLHWPERRLASKPGRGKSRFHFFPKSSKICGIVERLDHRCGDDLVDDHMDDDDDDDVPRSDFV